MKIRFAVGMGRNERIDEIGDLARLAEEIGFDHVTFVDQQNLSRDLYAMMTVAALNTDRIRIGHGVTVPYTRHPSVTANATATVNELSGGRVFLGLGAGGNALRSMGMRPRPLQEYWDLIKFMRAYMAGEEAEFKGARMRSEWIRQTVPIYMAADGPRSLEMAGEMADGVYFMGGPPELVKWKVDHIYKGAEKAGRDPSDIDICVRSFIYVTESKEKARRELAGFLPFGAAVLERYGKHPEIANLFHSLEREHPGILNEMKSVKEAYDERYHEHIDAPAGKLVTTRMIDCVHQVGNAEDICDGIYKLAQAGVTTIATATYTITDKKGMLREIADKIMPNFRS